MYLSKLPRAFVQIVKCICPKKKVNTLEVCIAAVYNSLVKFGHQVPPLMGMHDIKHWNFSHGNLVGGYFGGNLITYWFNFVWNRICTAFNPDGCYWVGIQLRSSWHQSRENIIHQYRHKLIKYPSIIAMNKKTNQSISINIGHYGIELRLAPGPWKYYPSISPINLDHRFINWHPNISFHNPVFVPVKSWGRCIFLQFTSQIFLKYLSNITQIFLKYLFPSILIFKLRWLLMSVRSVD